ncbi:MAG: D-hexose-6-phosphate mutarotase [Gammaproteobacteria bacterium]|nr:D-hexose-6-phosphate mutarotase [Gammaproteobacteria bacterium]
MKTVDRLRKEFQVDAISFSETNDEIINIEVNNKYAKACICLQGAQILDWTPVNQKPVIWMSADALFRKNKSVRGGVPVCWPWFGDHVSNPAFPAHGYVRNNTWELKKTETLPDGSTRLLFIFPENDEFKAYWPYKMKIELHVTIGEKLQIVLKTENLSDGDVTLTEALHTYFNISHIKNISVNGLNGCQYLDKLDGYSVKEQQDNILVKEEVDRIYINTPDEVCIYDSGYKRNILINKSESLSTIVWNPWKVKSDLMGDMGDDGYLGMVCVETANAASNAVNLSAGQVHEMSVEYKVECL